VRTDIGRYAIVPEWLLDSGVSSNAIRLFACLASKYADRDGQCYPGRKRLAEDLKVTSTDTVDRAAKELVAVGAIAITHRPDDTNVWELRFVPCGHLAAGERPPSRTDAALTRPTQPEILIPSESPKRAKSLSNPRRPFTSEDKAAFLEEFRGLPDVEGSIRKAMNSPGYQFGTDKYGHVRDWLLRDAERERRSHGTVGRNVRPGAQPQLPRSQAPGTHPGRAPDLVV
jgi:hypothetical protein